MKCPTCNDRGVYTDACGNPDRICTCAVGQSLPPDPMTAWVGGGPNAVAARRLAALNAEIDRLLDQPPMFVAPPRAGLGGAMNADAVEGRIKAVVLECWACARAAKRGALHLSGKALVRDATAHLIGGPGNRPLCERGDR